LSTQDITRDRSWFRADMSELIPRKGKDESYDEIVAEIKELEGELDKELNVFEKKLGFVHW
jgi:hypothetical protein